VLATSWLGRAEHLVTRDQGLLDLGRHDGVTILSPYDFLPRGRWVPRRASL